MRLKLLTTMAGPEGTFVSGSVVEFDSRQAADLLAGGYAVAIDPPEEAEKESEPEPKRGKKVRK